MRPMFSFHALGYQQYLDRWNGRCPSPCPLQVPYLAKKLPLCVPHYHTRGQGYGMSWFLHSSLDWHAWNQACVHCHHSHIMQYLSNMWSHLYRSWTNCKSEVLRQSAKTLTKFAHTIFCLQNTHSLLQIFPELLFNVLLGIFRPFASMFELYSVWL